MLLKEMLLLIFLCFEHHKYNFTELNCRETENSQTDISNKTYSTWLDNRADPNALKLQSFGQYHGI